MSTRSKKLYKITESPTLGRHLVALQDIPTGTLILDDQPLVSGPVVFEEQEGRQDKQLCCIVCCKRIITNSQGAIPCPKCSLRLFCSPKCTGDSLHSESNECDILMGTTLSQKLKDSQVSLKFVYNVVLTIRTLLLASQDPFKWEQVLSLQSKVPELERVGAFNSQFVDIFTATRPHQFGISDEEGGVSLLELAKHCWGSLRVNAFSAMISSHVREGLYFLSSFMAHSCITNTDRYCDAEDKGRMITRAARMIGKGEVISTSYLPLMEGTDSRWREMRTSWLFSCKCTRCCDTDNEMRTCLSTIRCPHCLELDFYPRVRDDCELVWNCNGCDKIVVGDLFESMVQKVKGERPPLDDMDRLEQWLGESQGNELHKDHWVFTQVRMYLGQCYGRTGSMRDDQLVKKVRHCEEVLHLMDKVMDGVFILKGVMFFELWNALMEVSRRKGMNKDGETGGHNILEQVDVSDVRIERTRIQGEKMLEFSPNNSQEESMLQVLRLNR